jgi:hypothetical protein
MPWQESDTMDQRLQFVRDALSERFDMTDLCARYGVSRKIGYKWLARFEAEGKADSLIAVAAHIRVPPRSGPPSPSSCASSADSIRIGGRGSCSRYCAVAIRKSKTGRPPVRRRSCSHGVAWCVGGGAVGRISIRGSCR